MTQQDASSSLVPIRIDVFSDDKALRVVDTILFDTNVWPIPLQPMDLQASLDANAWYIAQSVLGDAEVLGMGRTVRHFTGRLDLWSWRMLEKIHDCILPQLLAAVQQQVSVGPRKRKRERDDKAVDVVSTNKIKTESTGTPQEENQTESSTNTTAEEAQSSIAAAATTSDQPASDVQKSGDEIQPKETAVQADKVLSKDRSPSKIARPDPSSNENLIPIRIRMSVHGIRIHDDFLWDKSLAHVTSPITLAQSIANDLSLAPEAVQALAVNITEQIQGLDLLPDETPEADEMGPSGNRSKTSAAWPLEQRVHLVNLAHLVAQLRPTKGSAAK